MMAQQKRLDKRALRARRDQRLRRADERGVALGRWTQSEREIARATGWRSDPRVGRR